MKPATFIVVVMACLGVGHVEASVCADLVARAAGSEAGASMSSQAVDAMYDAWRQAFLVCRDDGRADAAVRAEATARWASVLARKGKVQKAEDVLREFQRELATDHPESLGARIAIADGLLQVLERQEKFAEADRVAREALTLRGEKNGAVSESVATGLLHLATLQKNQGHRDTAEALYRQAVEMSRTSCGPRCQTLATALGLLRTLIMSDPSRQAEADRLLEEALAARPSRGRTN